MQTLPKLKLKRAPFALAAAGCLLFAGAHAHADAPEADYDRIAAAMREATSARLKLASQRRAAALEEAKRAQLERAYAEKISSMKSELAGLKKSNAEAAARSAALEKRLSDAAVLLAELDALCDARLRGLFSNPLSKRALEKSGIEIPGDAELKDLDAAQKCSLLRACLEALLREDSKLVSENGAVSCGIWTRLEVSDRRLEDGVYAARVVRSGAEAGVRTGAKTGLKAGAEPKGGK